MGFNLEMSFQRRAVAFEFPVKEKNVIPKTHSQTCKAALHQTSTNRCHYRE